MPSHSEWSPRWWLPALVLGVAGTILWWAVHEHASVAPRLKAPPELPLAASPPAPPAVALSEAGSSPGQSISPAPVPEPKSQMADIPPEPSPRVEVQPGMLPWEEQIARLLGSGAPRRAKAQVLLSMIPSLPVEAYDTAAHEAVELLPDADYRVIGQPYVSNPQTNGAVLGILFADLMERPDAVALPALLAIARQPEHPYAAYARDNMALILGHSFAADWPAWESAIQQRLAGPGSK